MRSAPSPPTATGSIAVFAAWIRRYRVVRDRRTRAGHIAGSITNERWHTAWLLLGLVTTASALATGQHGWAIAITIFNVAFNLYPVCHQRYKRARLRTAPDVTAATSSARAAP